MFLPCTFLHTVLPALSLLRVVYSLSEPQYRNCLLDRDAQCCLMYQPLLCPSSPVHLPDVSASALPFFSCPSACCVAGWVVSNAPLPPHPLSHILPLTRSVSLIARSPTRKSLHRISLTPSAYYPLSEASEIGTSFS